MEMIPEQFDRFWSTARERQRIYARRLTTEPQPWTSDPIFLKYRFCNVRRYDDRVTKVIRTEVSLVGLDPARCFIATIAARWFNRVESIRCLVGMFREKGWDPAIARARLGNFVANGAPVVGGAFVIKTDTGMNKLEGVIRNIDRIHQAPEKFFHPIRECNRLEDAWKILQQAPQVAGFMAYEFVSDLRWTPMLHNAKDIETWANAGPGARRGVSRLLLGHPDGPVAQSTCLQAMQFLLAESKTRVWGKHEKPIWFPEVYLEIRDIEHWLCEFDKYSRAMEGGRLKQHFTPNTSTPETINGHAATAQ